MDEKTQLEVRKLLKRLGINSQEQLHNISQKTQSPKIYQLRYPFKLTVRNIIFLKIN